MANRAGVTILGAMKLTPTLAFSFLAVAALASAPMILSSFASPEPRAEAWVDGPLESSMQILQGSTKKLDKALEKGDMAAVLATTLEMQKSVHEAKVETPEKAATLTDAKEKAAFVLGFRKQMIVLEKALLDLEVAALDGKTEDATKIFNDTIKPMKKEGHGKYKD